jgi:hypothetical protein
LAVRRLGVQAVAFAWASVFSLTRALASLGRLRDGHDDDRVHTELGIARVLLGEAGVDGVVDPVDGETRFGNVGW